MIEADRDDKSLEKYKADLLGDFQAISPHLRNYRSKNITVRGAVKIASAPTCSPNGYYHTDS